MPTLLEHIAIAGLVALVVTRKPKWILLLCWVPILPDFDIFLGLHRIAFHTLVLLIPISIALITITAYRFPHYLEAALFIAFGLLSHTLLDTLQGWNAILWPLPLTFYLNITLTLLPTSPIPTPLLLIGPMIAPISILAEPTTGVLLGPYDTVFFLLFLSVALIKTWPTIHPAGQIY